MFHLLLLGRSWSAVLLWVSLLGVSADVCQKNATVSGKKTSKVKRGSPGEMLPTSVSNNHARLKWVKFMGVTPDYAVYADITYTRRRDFVCRPTNVRCKAGFYNPTKGSLCHYAPSGYPRSSSTFEILVNQDNFEKIQWVDASHGSHIPRSIKVCEEDTVFIAKHYYGLGGMYLKDKCFYLPYEGKQYWYWYYALLVVKTPNKQTLTDVVYDTTKSMTINFLPVILATSTIKNNGSLEVQESVTANAPTIESRSWNIDPWLTKNLRTTIHGSVPTVKNNTMGKSRENLFEFCEEIFVATALKWSFTVDVTVPRGTECQVYVVGTTHKLSIPFTGVLSRYRDSDKWSQTTLNGVFGNLYTDFLVLGEDCKAKLTAVQETT